MRFSNSPPERNKRVHTGVVLHLPDSSQHSARLCTSDCQIPLRLLKTISPLHSEGVVSKDHMHILVNNPPDIAPSEIMRKLKGGTSNKLFDEFPTPRNAIGAGIIG